MGFYAADGYHGTEHKFGGSANVVRTRLEAEKGGIRSCEIKLDIFLPFSPL
jgi:hypothetical protein